MLEEEAEEVDRGNNSGVGFILRDMVEEVVLFAPKILAVCDDMEASGDLTLGTRVLELDAGLILRFRVDEATEGLVLLIVPVTTFGLLRAFVDIAGIEVSTFAVLAILEVDFVSCRFVTGGAQAVRDCRLSLLAEGVRDEVEAVGDGPCSRD